ncbi:MAG: hypothetical protein IJZ54_06645 [Clostridia bacterium]|nr:hypothetical protein [Clostridia bacterium]
MKKITLYKIFYIVSIMLAAAFCVLVAVDSYRYSVSLNSAPFYVFVFARAIVFLVPALIAFIVGKVLHKKSK